MDGTFYLGERMIPGAGGFARSLESKGLDYRFFTNNSSHARDDCLRKLAGMEFPVARDKVIISTDVAANWLQKNFAGARVYLLGNENMARELQGQGIRLAEDTPDLILLGFDTTLNYEKITKAANWIAAGLPYIATHPDRNCPVPGGFLPDTGSMIALFEASAGRRPLVLGKPERATADYLASVLSCEPDELCFVGDRLETDIAIGHHGSPTVLVLTGVTTRAQLEAQDAVTPGLVVESLAQLQEYL